MATTTERRDVHAEITATIIAQIEAGAGMFSMPWHQSSTGPLQLPCNIASKKDYRGINILSLWGAALNRGYSSNVWGTYKQWQAAGCQVRKGERASLVVVYKEFDVEPDADNPRDDGRRMFARASFAFNADQVDGFERPAPPADHGPIARITAADAFVKASGADVRTGGTRAFYAHGSDHVQMPSEGLFFGAERSEAFYAVLLHELTHWTGAKRRLDREFGKRFGDRAYSFEELVAELGAAFLCARLGITNAPREDHAQYIAHWLGILKDDKRAIFHAAAKASAAVDYLADKAAKAADVAAARAA